MRKPQDLWPHALPRNLHPGHPLPRLGRFGEPPGGRRAVQQQEALQNRPQGHSPSHLHALPGREERRCLGGSLERRGRSHLKLSHSDCNLSAPSSLEDEASAGVLILGGSGLNHPLLPKIYGVGAERLGATVGAGGASDGPAQA